jgi:hypothetical protein
VNFDQHLLAGWLWNLNRAEIYNANINFRHFSLDIGSKVCSNQDLVEIVPLLQRQRLIIQLIEKERLHLSPRTGKNNLISACRPCKKIKSCVPPQTALDGDRMVTIILIRMETIDIDGLSFESPWEVPQLSRPKRKRNDEKVADLADDFQERLSLEPPSPKKSTFEITCGVSFQLIWNKMCLSVKITVDPKFKSLLQVSC